MARNPAPPGKSPKGGLCRLHPATSAAMRRHCRAGLTLFATFLFAGVASATSTRFFRQTTAKDFEEGEATASMVSPAGRGGAGHEESAAWPSTRRSSGAPRFRATGRRPTSAPATTDASSPSARRPAPRKRGRARRRLGHRAGCAARRHAAGRHHPGRRVYTVDPKTGKSSAFAKLAAEHVWALVHDASAA